MRDSPPGVHWFPDQAKALPTGAVLIMKTSKMGWNSEVGGLVFTWWSIRTVTANCQALKTRS